MLQDCTSVLTVKDAASKTFKNYAVLCKLLHIYAAVEDSGIPCGCGFNLCIVGRVLGFAPPLRPQGWFSLQYNI